MLIYIAHNFEAREFLPKVVQEIESKGHIVTSRWIFHASEDKTKDATMDLADLEKADTFFLFADNYGDRPGKGKYVEFGFALRGGKRCFVIGEDDSCVFYHLPNVRRVKTLKEALELL